MTDIERSDFPLGARFTSAGVSFKVWAPDHESVEVEFASGAPSLALAAVGRGYFAGRDPHARPGALYRFRLDDRERHPDPYSRFQPNGPDGPSMVIDPTAYQWKDSAWQGLDPSRQVIYELHVGTFTPSGTYQAAAGHLQELRDLGITCIELMPVNEFTGRFGWGYDGVNWFAPFHPYGEPDELRALVDRAHELGLGVILDVVYNHFGHFGNFLPRFAAGYLTDQVKNPWGAAPNYQCDAMRRLAIDNAAYWIREFHFDGLRLDAIQSIDDPQSPALLSAITAEARLAAGSRTIIIAAEDYEQRGFLLGAPGTGGAGLDYLWNDDFHHSCRVALTGNSYAYFKNYRGSAQEILSCLKRGFLFQGQFDGWKGGPRGFPTGDAALHSFITFTQNHDAVANTLYGQRLHSIVDPGRYRALTAVLILGPLTPLLFMGQEFNASTPFAYFADYPNDAQVLWQGRRKEAQQFLQYQDPAALERVLDPCAVETVQACTLNHSERARETPTLALYSDLIKLRQQLMHAVTPSGVDGAVLTEHSFVFRWSVAGKTDHMLIVNLGNQLDLPAWPEPLLAPPLGTKWQQCWSSDAVKYGGMGEICATTAEGWRLSANCAYLVVASAADS